MTRTSRMEPAPGSAPQGAPEVADFQRLREIGAALISADVPREQTEREFLAVAARLLDAEACALAVNRDGKVVLRDLALDQQLAGQRAVLSSELRLVAASAARDGRAIAVPCESMSGRILLASPAPGGAFVIVAVVRGNNAQLSGERATLELAALALNAGRPSEAQRLEAAIDRVLELKPTDLNASRLRSMFDASIVMISGPRGRGMDVSPAVAPGDNAPAGRMISDVFSRSPVEAPHIEMPELAAALNVSSVHLLNAHRPGFRILVANPGGIFRQLSPAHWTVVVMLLPELKTRLSARRSPSLVRWRRRLPALMMIVGLVGILAIPIEDRIRAAAVLEPDGQRFVTAQFSAILSDTFTKPGDSVSAGDVLGRLEGEALQLARTAADARAEDAARRRDTALRQKEIAAAELSRLDERSAVAERDLLDWQLERLEIRAPIDGVVLASNFENAAGAPVREGDVIFEISPLDTLRVRVEIPIADLARMPGDPSGTLLLDGEGTDVEIELGSLSPRARAVVADGQTVLPHDTTILNGNGNLRPGQRGLVIVPAGTARFGEILFRRAWIRMSRWLR